MRTRIKPRMQFKPNPDEIFPDRWSDAVTLYAMPTRCLTRERIGPVVGTGILGNDGLLHVDLITDCEGRPPFDPLARS